jgi:hypothetical protein
MKAEVFKKLRRDLFILFSPILLSKDSQKLFSANNLKNPYQNYSLLRAKSTKIKQFSEWVVEFFN